MRFVLFISVFISIMIALNIYSYRRFLSRLHAPLNRYSLIFTLTLIFGNVFFVVEMMNRFIPDSMLLYSISGATIGVSFMVFVVALIYDLNITVSKQVPFDQERRKTLKILFDITMFIAAIAYLIRGLTDGLKYPEVNTVKVKIKDFPLPAYKIVQLSDVHVGRTIKKSL